MKISYCGSRKLRTFSDAKSTDRFAIIESKSAPYNDEKSRKDMEKTDKVADILAKKGWHSDGFVGNVDSNYWIRVDDREEYDELVADCREAKKMVLAGTC